jgi:hypothetical protein
MTLDDILNSKTISVRSYNVCNDNGLKNLTDLLCYYKEHKTFDKLKNCGRRSNEELINFCTDSNKTFISFESEMIKHENPLIKIVTDLNRNQREVINNFIEINFKSLSVRSQNVLSLFLNGNLKISNLSTLILANDSFKVRNLKKAGKRTEEELVFFIKVITEFLEKVTDIRIEKHVPLVSISTDFFFLNYDANVFITDEIIKTQSIFKYVNILIDQNLIYKDGKKTVFQRALKIYYKHPEPSLEDIAETLSTTKERVRVIAKKCIEGLFGKLEVIKILNDDLIQKYFLDTNQDFISVDEQAINYINQQNDTQFSKEFATFILYVYWSNRFEIIGVIEDVLKINRTESQIRYNWNNLYLIETSLFNEFDFSAFADDLDSRLHERIEETYSFNLKSYLSKFLNYENHEVLARIASICERIINDEFGISIDLDDNIIFVKNTIKPFYQYSYDALLAIGRPSKVKEITNKIKETYSDYDVNEAKVRASMKQNRGFVPIGRTSTFGLKEWEGNLDNFKGGTIRQIVYDYLKGTLLPKNISQITEYVLTFRPKTYEKSVYSNLKADESDDFIFFENSTIGLSIKTYDKSYVEEIQLEKRKVKSWNQNYNEIVDFANKNGRLPYSSGSSAEETRQYHWYAQQCWKSKSHQLNEEKRILIAEVLMLFDTKDIPSKRSIIKAEKHIALHQFVIEKGRLPSASKKDEYNLYSFFYKERKLFQAGKLEKKESINFMKINELIQQKK